MTVMNAQYDPAGSLRHAAIPDVLYRIAIVFFTFPLLAPAINDTVIYPFIFVGLALCAAQHFNSKELLLPAATVAVLGLCAIFDPLTSLRMASFYFACLFFVKVLSTPRLRKFMLSMGYLHAWVIIAQFTLLLAGIEIDFSKVLRVLYGPLLPGTGEHIDYNAFSQFDFFFPRVAGINREPAFAAVLYLAWLSLSIQDGKRWRSLIFLAAMLFSLSKIILALLPVYALVVLSLRAPATRTAWGRVGNFAVFVVSQLVIYAIIYAFQDAISGVADLDASFYHRFIGMLTVARSPHEFGLIGSSWSDLIKLPSIADYEFLNFRRGFFDGNLLPKLLVDFGWVALTIYVMLVVKFARNWINVLAVSYGGLFINLLSVSPATVATFILLLGMGTASDVASRRAAVASARAPAPRALPPPSVT